MRRNSSHLSIISDGGVIVSLFCFHSLLFNTVAQRVNDPGLNTKLVINGSNPQNISTIKDGRGCGFIVWQDDRMGIDKVYFTHFDSKGKPTLP